MGHEVWSGNTSDKNTSDKPAFKQVIEKIKTKFDIKKVILVCDRGMVSEEIINYLEENKYEYILEIKMRCLSKMRKNILLAEKDFKNISSNIFIKEMTEGDLYEIEQKRINVQKIKEGHRSTINADRKIEEYKTALGRLFK